MESNRVVSCAIEVFAIFRHFEKLFALYVGVTTDHLELSHLVINIIAFERTNLWKFLNFKESENSDEQISVIEQNPTRLGLSYNQERIYLLLLTNFD